MQSASGIAAAVCGGAVRAADVLAEARRRHDATHARLNALVQPRFDAAREEAALVTPGSPLAGVPVSVKDCFPVRGLSTTLGIVARRGLRDTADAALVARLRCLGALVVGKANVPQAMLLHETDNPVWGRTNHPLDPGRGPGGSSGGDAALVAAGVVPLAIGNDLAGSLRQPAHACGIAALMPRSTALGEGGAVDTVPHLEVVRPRAGFLAAHVADLRLALHAVVRGAPPSAAAGPSAGMRIGWWDDGGPVPASAAVVRAVGEAVGSLSRAGSEMVRLDGGIAGEAAWLHLAILAADGGSDIRALFGGEQPIAGVARLLGLAGLPRGLRPVLAAVARLTGRRIEAEALGRTGPRDAAGLGRLLEARAALARRFETLVAGLDAVVCPVSALPALRHGTAAQLVVAAAPCLLANLLDLPAGAVPVTEVRPGEEATRPRSRDPVLRAAAECDRGCAGLPVGVQVVACPGRDEDAVLDVMAAVEAARQPPSRATIARGI